MKSTLLRLACLWSLLASICLASVTPPFTARELAQGYSDTAIIAKPRALRAASIGDEESRENLALRRHFPRFGGVRVLRLPTGDTADQAVARLRASGRYEYVERDLLRRALLVPNDPSFSQQWALNNTGQSSGTVGADIRAVDAWNTTTDASSVIVAVIDTGARQSHSDLAGNLWTSSTNTHGINSTVSTSSGSYNSPEDDSSSGHGTHVAGIIGALGNNGIATTGIAWSARIMPLKFLPASGTGTLSDELECIDYAISHGAKIINASYGDSAFSQSEYDAIKAARNADIVFVAAAGNDALNNDLSDSYPCNYALDNIVAVAASTRGDKLDASFSDYGPGSVELAAPGTDILSLSNASNTATKLLSGTSMAAPQVSGALALLRARFPGDNYRQSINRLLRSVTKLPALSGKVLTGGRLNVAAALATATNRPFNDSFDERTTLIGSALRVRASNLGATADPGEPVHAGVPGGASIWFSWTAPGTGSVAFDTAGSSYDTVLALYTGASVGSLTPVASNDDSGTAQARIVFNVTAGTTYQIAIDGKNGASGYTALSIVAPPPNDDFASAQVVTGTSFKVTSSNLNAARETGEPSPLASTAGDTVWFKWTAPASGPCLLSAYATEIDTTVAIYTGTALSNLTVVASNDNSTANPTNTDALAPFTATAGTTYYFQVDHASSDGNAGGEFILTLVDADWEYPVKDEITSSPAVAADGTIYFGAGSENAYDLNLYAVSSTGAVKWGYSTLSSGTGIVGASPVVSTDGTVYIGSTDRRLIAINPGTGTRRWSYTAATAITSSPALATDGTIYFRDDTTLYALNTSGALKWSFALTGSTEGTYSSPSVATDGTIYVGTNGGYLHAVNPSGSLKWSYTADGDIYASPSIAGDGTIYFATFNGTVYALNPAGAKLWSWTASGNSSITSTIALGPDGSLYFAGYDHKLHALTPSGIEKWSFTLGDEVRLCSPAVAADGAIYIGCYDGLLYAINPDGTLRRTYATAKQIRSSPVIAGSRLYFGSADAKLYAIDLRQTAAVSAWPMFRRDAVHTARAVTAPVISTQPVSQTAAVATPVALSVVATGSPTPTILWQRDGADFPSGSTSTLSFSGVYSTQAGIYTAVVTGATIVRSSPAVIGVTTSEKVAGSGTEVGFNIPHPNGNVYDQVLLTGPAATITADPGQVTRLSYIDLSDDIVQVEFGGAGSLTLVLENPTGPATPVNYNQPGVSYMRGHAHIVIAGANETTNVSVFSVGRFTAFDPTGAFNFLLPISASNNPANNGSSLFSGHADTHYDGFADLASIAILSTNGKFGGIRTANASYLAAAGYTGIYAPGVQFTGPVYLGDITASGSATPVILLGSAATTQINGGSLLQLNGAPVQVSGLTQLKFVAGIDSQGNTLPAQANQAHLEQNGADVTAQIVVNPP